MEYKVRLACKTLVGNVVFGEEVVEEYGFPSGYCFVTEVINSVLKQLCQ